MFLATALMIRQTADNLSMTLEEGRSFLLNEQPSNRGKIHFLLSRNEIRPLKESKSWERKVGPNGNRKVVITRDLWLRPICFDIKQFWETGLPLARRRLKL